MSELTEEECFEGVEVDLTFDKKGPVFGDLFTICGYENPNFPPPGDYKFNEFENLKFSQVDDYFGIENETEEGDDVIVWLYPLVAGNVVDHHPGPFDGIRLSYNVLRHPIQRSENFFKVTESISNKLPVTLSEPLEQLKIKVNLINEYWLKEGVTPGTDEALVIDY